MIYPQIHRLVLPSREEACDSVEMIRLGEKVPGIPSAVAKTLLAAIRKALTASQ